MMEAFIMALSDIVQESAEYLHSDRRLDEIPMWDSTAQLVFMALADRDYQTKIKPSALRQAVTVGDLFSLLKP
jgi:acyl carrier protein